jgi:thiamine-monophosphate kinase
MGKALRAHSSHSAGVSAIGPGREFDLIRGFLRGGAPLPAEVRVGPGDDCAVVGSLAISTDLSVEGVHFRRDWLRPREIGWRAAAAALSDLAAMGARPVGVLVSLSVPPADAGSFATALMLGAREAVEAVGGVLLGGDLTRSPAGVAVDVVVVGESERPVLRSGARPGDGLWVTGELGGAAAFVRARVQGGRPRRGARSRFARPEPRIAAGRWLAERGIATAMLDLSDGLAGDATHLAAASGVAIDLQLDDLPVHTAADPELALRGGEDYELCFTASDLHAETRSAFAADLGLRLTRVGTVRRGRGVWIERQGRRDAVGSAGFQHFKGG